MKEQIKNLDCKKHVKIYKLHVLGLSNKEIASELTTGAGHVYNVLKDYKNKPELVTAADLFIIPHSIGNNEFIPTGNITKNKNLRA